MVTSLSPSTSRRNFNINGSNKPSWLLSTLSDLEARMKTMAMNPTNEEQKTNNEGDTFAERAESYYRKRPQLLALLQDLYNSYVTLSDRYIQSNSKNTPTPLKRHVSQDSMTANDADTDSDAESSLSYQQPHECQCPSKDTNDYDAIVAELVAKSIELEAAVEEAAGWERRCGESARKAELQRSLLEVLESERVVLLNENARLEYRAAALSEENKGLAAEALFMRRRAAELARRAVARMREDQRVCMLSRKIEDLQGQIYGLEKRNKEYYEKSQYSTTTSTTSSGYSSTSSCASLKNEAEKDRNKMRNEVVFEGCFKMTRKIKIINPKIRMIKKSKCCGASVGGDNKGNSDEKKSGLVGFWERVKRMDLFLCGVKV